jgi:DNA-directed RNA polymerase sigma subunit (sigma70/sigma32)
MSSDDAAAIDSGLIGGYLARLERRARRSPADERELVAAAKAGDRRARERVVELYLPRISVLASHYRFGRTIDRFELLQEGVVGLLRALERYDADRGVPFWAYAQWWVR